MRIKTQGPTTVTLDILEFSEFVERTRHACVVALGDLHALGMPSADTSTGRLLMEVIRDAEALQTDLNAS